MTRLDTAARYAAAVRANGGRPVPMEAPDVAHLVRCPNGLTHRFDSEAAAYEFAEWGHCCLAVARHQIRTVPT